MKRLLIVLVLGVCGLPSYSQQRALTSTYPLNGLLLNPAYAGSLNVLSVIAVHREQWINIDGAPSYDAFTAHTSFNDNRVGVGLMATRDQVGATASTSVYGSYAYKIKTSFGILAMGLQGGFDNRRTNFSQLHIQDGSDEFLTGTASRFTPNFGVGLYFANPWMYVGFASPYILENKTFVEKAGQTNVSESKESRYYYGTGGIIVPLTSNVKLSPSVLLRMQESNRISYEFTGFIIFDGIAYAGVGVRNSGDLVFLGQFILNENLRVGYAYDATTSDLNQQTAGSHEVLVNYRIKLRNFRKDPQCPVYF